MRAMRDPDAFISGDLGVRRELEALGRDATPAAAARLAERWRPYRAYAVQYLWASLERRKRDETRRRSSNARRLVA
jgi:AraC family transcriptional regulator of adaptative response / DNA-3-methyladenine glycosylase II